MSGSGRGFGICAARRHLEKSLDAKVPRTDSSAVIPASSRAQGSLSSASAGPAPHVSPEAMPRCSRAWDHWLPCRRPSLLHAVFALVLTLALAPRPCHSQSLSEAFFSLPSVATASSRRTSNGPCTPRATAPVIVVKRPGHLGLRTRYGPTQTTIMRLATNLRLTAGLSLGPNWSCTIFVSANRRQPATIFYKGWDAPVLTIFNASNMVFVNVNLRNGVTHLSPRTCDLVGRPYDHDMPCPALYIFGSYHIQYTRAQILGRAMVVRSVYCRLDSLTVTQPPNPQPGDQYDGPGIVQFLENGVGGGRDIVKSGNILSNSHVYGAYCLVALSNGAVGVTIRNNYFHDFIWASLRCGDKVHATMDCHENLVANNYVWTQPYKRLTGDSAGFYFSNKWFNPGNKVTCNYVIGGDRCFYIDFASSGVEIDGGVCIYMNMGTKMNTGKWNKVRDLVMVGLNGTTHLLSCIATPLVNCFKAPGSYWETRRAQYFNLPSINAKYPYMQKICNPQRQVTHNGVLCNSPGSPNGDTTGWCSGFPQDNQASYVVVQAGMNQRPRSFCQYTNPAADQFNTASNFNLSLAQGMFINPGQGDFGVLPGSPILREVPQFTSCPRSAVGPQRVLVATYYNAWNKPEPANYDLVQTAQYYFGM